MGDDAETLFRVYGADGTLLLAGWDGREMIGLARAIAAEHVTRVRVTAERTDLAERTAIELDCPDVAGGAHVVPTMDDV